MQYKISDFKGRVVLAKFYQTGVYKIECTDGRCYVGSTAQSFKKRWLHHINQLKKNKHHSKYLQNVYNKHGLDYFSFSILEIVEDSNKIIEREQYWLDLLTPQLNVLRLADSCLGHKHSYETRKKFSNAKRTGKSGTGVHYKSKKGSYHAAICCFEYKIDLGYYRSYEEALEARLKGEALFWSEEFESKTKEEKETIIVDFRSTYQAEVANRSKDSATIKARLTKEEKKGYTLGVWKLKEGFKAFINVDDVPINLGRYLEESEAINIRKEAEDFYYSIELRAKPKDDRIAFIKQTVKDKLFYSRSTLKTKTSEKYVRHLKNDTFLFSHEKSRHYRSFKTLDEAVLYRNNYLSSDLSLQEPKPKRVLDPKMRFIRVMKNNTYKFVHKPSKHQKTFSSLEEAVEYREKFLASGCTLVNEPKSGHKFIRQNSRGTWIFKYNPTNHFKTLKTLEEAVAYKEQYLANLEILTLGSN